MWICWSDSANTLIYARHQLPSHTQSIKRVYVSFKQTKLCMAYTSHRFCCAHIFVYQRARTAHPKCALAFRGITYSKTDSKRLFNCTHNVEWLLKSAILLSLMHIFMSKCGRLDIENRSTYSKRMPLSFLFCWYWFTCFCYLPICTDNCVHNQIL